MKTNNENLLKLLLIGKESKEIDYKGPFLWDRKDKNTCNNIVKDILALANTKGGYLIIGVSEKHDGFNFDVGLSKEELGSFDTTKINQYLNNYADPPINTELYKVPYNGKDFIIISVPVFSDTPHICQKDHQGILSEATIYVRTDNNESAPLKKSSDLRNIVNRAITNTSDQLLIAFRSIMKSENNKLFEDDPEKKYLDQINALREKSNKLIPVNNKKYGYRELIFYPKEHNQINIENSKLSEIARKACINYRGMPLIFFEPETSDMSYIINNGIESVITKSITNIHDNYFYYFNFYSNGLVYIKTILDEDSYFKNPDDKQTYLYISAVCQVVAESIKALNNVYKNIFSDDAEIVYSHKLTGLKDRVLKSTTPGLPLGGEYKSREDFREYKDIRTLGDWKTGEVQHSLEISKYFFQIFNLDRNNLVIYYRKMIEDLFQRRLM